MALKQVTWLLGAAISSAALIGASLGIDAGQFTTLDARDLHIAVAGCPGNVPLIKNFCHHDPFECNQKWDDVFGAPLVPAGCDRANADWGCNDESGYEPGDANENGSKGSHVQCDANYDYCTCWVGILENCYHGTINSATCGTKDVAVPAC